MSNIRLLAVSVFLLGVVLAQSAPAGDWLQWRGPMGTGQSDEKSAPLTWSKTENVKWRTALDGPGNSSPIVVGQKVFIAHRCPGAPQLLDDLLHHHDVPRCHGIRQEAQAACLVHDLLVIPFEELAVFGEEDGQADQFLLRRRKIRLPRWRFQRLESDAAPDATA